MVTVAEDVAEGSLPRPDDEEDEPFAAVARPMTASCVDSILQRAQADLYPPSPGSSSEHEYALRCDSMTPSVSDLELSNTGAAVATPVQQASPNSRGKRARGRRCHGAMGTQAARGAEIARVLAAPRCPAEVRDYAARFGGGFGRIPAFLRPVATHLDAEQRYIVALCEPREPPSRRVKLLAKGEKDRALLALKQQLQQAGNVCAKAKPKGRTRQRAEADIARLKADVAHLERPYVFTEDRTN